MKSKQISENKSIDKTENQDKVINKKKRQTSPQRKYTDSLLITERISKCIKTQSEMENFKTKCYSNLPPNL